METVRFLLKHYPAGLGLLKLMVSDDIMDILITLPPVTVG
jgi:hypothetical protein